MSPPHISYQLLIEIETPIAVRVGALGVHVLDRGRYVYTGSARRHLQARIARHRRREKRLRWHIDYLLAQPQVRLLEARTSALAECPWNQSLAATIPIPGFGASDCRQGCISHLKFLT